ncbi:hypothetical protein ES704_00629 [subsurface metagenome]|jgi:hypothetical protein
MKYEWYSPTTGAPVVSVAEYGITFNNGAIEMMGKPEYVILGYDEENKFIGVKPCDVNEENRIEFYKKMKNKYIRLANKDFIRFLKSIISEDIKIESKAKRYVAKWDKEEKILYIDLNSQIGVDKKINASKLDN